MNTFTAIFLLMVALMVGTRLWLARRQIAHVQRHRDRVPDAFKDWIPEDAHRKAADYTAAKTRVAQVSLLLSTALILIWTLGGGINALDHLWAAAGWNTVATGTAVMLSLLLLNALVELPLDAYQTFRVEQRFGFNRATVGLFLNDALKSGVLLIVVGVPLAAIALWLMQTSGALWWLYVWLVWAVFMLGMTWAYPALIAPLFNRFTPLKDEALRERIDDLVRRCGFSAQGVFVMDGSTRSAHGNAYFTGMGNNKRIVFFDTLLESLEPRQVEAVLAHELGHFRLKHIRRRLMVLGATTLLGLAILAWIMGQPWFYSGLGVAEPSNHAALLLFLLVGPVFAFPLRPLAARWSRKHEFEADHYAAQHADPEALVEALVRLYKDNATTLTPDPIHSAVYDSHPPAAHRIARLRELAGQTA